METKDWKGQLYDKEDGWDSVIVGLHFLGKIECLPLKEHWQTYCFSAKKIEANGQFCFDLNDWNVHCFSEFVDGKQDEQPQRQEM